MAKISYFVYRTDRPGVTAGMFMVTKWGVCEAANLSAQAWRASEVAVANTTNRTFTASLGDNGLAEYHFYNPTSGAFATELSGLVFNLPFGGVNQAINFGVQEHARDSTPDQLLRYFGSEGSFGLGSMVPSSITNFTTTVVPTGFYYAKEDTAVGGPDSGDYTLLVLVQQAGDPGVMFHARRIATGSNYREWVGIRPFPYSAVTWIDVTSGGALAKLDTIDLTYLPTVWVKEGCRLCSVNNINVTTGGLPTIDSVAATDGSRILLVGQTNPAENGIWIASTGAWSRASDANTTTQVLGATVSVFRGLLYGGTTWTTTFEQPNTLGTTAMNWFQVMHSGTTFGGSVSGVVPVSTGGTINFLRADGAWADPTLASETATVTATFATGATVSGATKTVNIGTGGLSGSTTIVTVGSAVSGSLGEVRFNGPSVRMNAGVDAFYMNTAAFFRTAPTPSSFAAAATLTVADLTKGIVLFTGASNANLTLPTGADLDAAFPNLLSNVGFEFSVIATGAGTATLANSTGVTRVGSGSVAGGTSGRFLFRRTGTAETWVLYRL